MGKGPQLAQSAASAAAAEPSPSMHDNAVEASSHSGHAAVSGSPKWSSMRLNKVHFDLDDLLLSESDFDR